MKWKGNQYWLLSKHDHGLKNGNRIILLIGDPPRKQAMRIVEAIDVHTIRCRPWRWHDWATVGYWYIKQRIEKAFEQG